MEALGFKMEPWELCMPVVTNLQHCDEEQDPDPHKVEAQPQHFLPGTRMLCHFSWLQIRCRRIEIRIRRIKTYKYESGNASSPEVPSSHILARRNNYDLFNGFIYVFFTYSGVSGPAVLSFNGLFLHFWVDRKILLMFLIFARVSTSVVQ